MSKPLRRHEDCQVHGCIAIGRCTWLGLGLRHHEPTARVYAARLAVRGKHSMIIWTALANRANRIAFAMVGDQTVYDPTRWR